MATRPKFQVPSDFGDSDDDDLPAAIPASHFKPGQILASVKRKETVPANGQRTSDCQHHSVIKPSTSSNLLQTTSSKTENVIPNSNPVPTTTTSTTSETDKSPAPPISSTSKPTSKPTSAYGSSGINSMIVNPKQRGNPILKYVTNVSWEYGDIVPDYQVGLTSCVLYLSLRYHNLNPEYIQTRLKQLGNMYMLRVLLAQVDIKDPHHALKELAMMCILANCTLIVAWTPEEAGRYLETYKAYENKPPDALMERPETDFEGRVADALTTVKGVNKTDATTLLTTFDSLSSLIDASEEKLLLCPGLGPLKARRLHDLFHIPFANWK